jgi:hypothetical protein
MSAFISQTREMAVKHSSLLKNIKDYAETGENKYLDKSKMRKPNGSLPKR